MGDGIFYVANRDPIGDGEDDYFSEARRSAASARRQMPDVEIALLTDETNVTPGPFDEVLHVDNLRSDFGASRLEPDASPFDRTLYLDTDTYVYTDVSELFDILDGFDLAVTISPSRAPVPGVPKPWAQYNTGVFSYRSSAATVEFLERWGEIYERWREERGVVEDQPSFARAVYESDIDVFTLASEYNCRVPRFGYLCGEAKIVHGRHSSGLETVARELNATTESRVYWPKSYNGEKWALNVQNDPSRSRRHVLVNSLQENGLAYTVKEGVSHVTAALKRRL